MSAPAEFVVARHVVSHPAESQAELGRHLGLASAVVSRVMARLRNQGILTEHQLLEHLRRLPRRPGRQAFTFHAPNPELWFKQYDGPYLASGEAVAAQLDSMPIVPSRFLAYISPQHIDAAVRAAFDVFAKVAPPDQANLELRIRDPWVRPGESDNVVERGQRLLDYAESRHIQLLRGLAQPGGILGGH